MSDHLPECPVAGRRGTVNDSDCTCYQHLPECILPKGYGDCICEELRAYGDRVLGAAREAVVGMNPAAYLHMPRVHAGQTLVFLADALDAIDALREGEQ